ncbi:LexA family protein [Thermus thalpophilus]|uniref:LexA family protein n=1 Tax=Thermus thalpophilus TaxID=2908147 RepID=UPI001FA94874|nr:S24 family peptidase [Thermus thalpophilus]
MKLPPGQRRVLKAVAERLREGFSPTAHDLTRLLGLRPQTLRQHLEALQKKGLLRLYPGGHGRPTHLELTPEGLLLAGTAIPLVGRIPAGPLEEAWEEVEGLLALPGRPGLFALVVEGDSMAEYLLEGDVVVVERGPKPRRGEVAAVFHEGRTTLKYVYLEGEEVVLKPHNPAYPTVRLPAREVEVQGVFRFLLRGREALEALAILRRL